MVVDSLDEDRRLVELRYHFTGTTPLEEIRVRGKRVEPFVTKARDFTYLRRSLIHERILWVPADGTLEIKLDEVPVPLTFDWPKSRQYTVRPAKVQARRGSKLRSGTSRTPTKAQKRGGTVSVADRVTSALARSSLIRRQFADAWVLMDRDVNANDNAEHLFRYLRRRRRDINAWFVVEKNSPDWNRLRNEGYNRLIPYGSTLWKALCLNARYIVSSHADAYVYSPFVLSNGAKLRWKFVFLQHGVIKDNLAHWLNGKKIAGMVTSTVDEFASIAGDLSPYKLSAKDVSLTGMPRHDLLAKKASTYTRDERPLITVMPTWRQFLVGDTIGRGNRRHRNRDFFESEFLRQWMDTLESPELQRMAEEHKCRIMFMPHPNLEDYLPGLTLPNHVEVRSFSEINVQDVIAQSAVVVTDYSSIAFDAAIVHRPVVYYQSDRERVFGGDHLTKPGYFSYDRAGFGPVALDHDQVLEALRTTLEHGKEPAPEYRRRIERTFVTPGRACSRVTEMIEELDHPVCIGDHRPTPKAPEIQYTN